MKKIILMLTLVVAFSLMSCSEAKKITDEQVLESLKANAFVVETSESIDTFTVKSRELSDDKKTETIESELIYISELARFTATFTTTCTKGEEGWQIDESELEDYEVVALSGPTDQEIFSAVEALKQGELIQSGLSLDGKSIFISNLDLEDNTAQYTVKIVYEDPYVAESGSAVVVANFDYQIGWALEVTYYTVTRVWLPGDVTYELDFTVVVNNDKNAKSFDDIYFAGFFSEVYTKGGHREEDDQIYLWFEGRTYDFHGITKQPDSMGSNLFLLKYGASSTNHSQVYITYEYDRQEFYAATRGGSSGYFRINK